MEVYVTLLLRNSHAIQPFLQEEFRKKLCISGTYFIVILINMFAVHIFV